MVPSDNIVWSGRSRAWFVVWICLVMAVAQGLYLLGAQTTGAMQEVTFAAAASVAGLSFGAMWPHLVVLSSELFGSEHLSSNYMFYDGGCGAVGTLVLANALPNSFYDTSAGSTKCLGSSCFAPTHWIILCLNLSGAAAALVIVFRSRELYQEISKAHKSKLDDEENKEKLLSADLVDILDDMIIPDDGK